MHLTHIIPKPEKHFDISWGGGTFVVVKTRECGLIVFYGQEFMKLNSHNKMDNVLVKDHTDNKWKLTLQLSCIYN